MEIVFWLFQIVLTAAMGLMGVQQILTHTLVWNTAFAVSYSLIEMGAWAAWDLSARQNNIAIFFKKVLAVNFIAGLVLAIVVVMVAEVSNPVLTLAYCFFAIAYTVWFGFAPTSCLYRLYASKIHKSAQT